MAIVLRGKNKGKIVHISQWCNDWVTSTGGKVYKITALEFTEKEIFDILQHQNNGIMFDTFEKIPCQNKFRKKRYY